MIKPKKKINYDFLFFSLKFKMNLVFQKLKNFNLNCKMKKNEDKIFEIETKLEEIYFYNKSFRTKILLYQKKLSKN